MRKLFLSAFAAALIMTAVFTSCSNDDESVPSVPSVLSVSSVPVTFALGGDWQGSDESFAASRRRRAAAVSGSSMTDVWVFDYMGGTLKQQVHQSSGDEDFGAPTVSLDYGEHTLYFVTSCGDTPTLNTTNHTLAFTKVKDTFWKSVAVNVTSGTAANQSVTMDRVVTKLIIQPTDAVPASINTISLVLGTWYNTMDYLTGLPTAADTNYDRTLTVPDSYKGTTGTFSVNITGFCGADFTTAIAVTAKDGENATIGYASIASAQLKRNRASRYTGTLFGNDNALSLGINDEWLSEFGGTW